MKSMLLAVFLLLTSFSCFAYDDPGWSSEGGNDYLYSDTKMNAADAEMAVDLFQGDIVANAAVRNNYPEISELIPELSTATELTIWEVGWRKQF